MQAQISTFWKNTHFVKLITAGTLSNIGDWFDFFALQIIFITRWQASPLLISLMIVAFLGPGFIFSQLAGSFIDRYNKAVIMAVTDIISALLTLCLIFSPSAPIAIAVIILRAISNSFNNPCQFALVQQLVKKDHLLKASSYQGISYQISKILGPLLGAAVVAYYSPNLCLLINAISFIISAITIITLYAHTPALLENKKSKLNLIQDWKLGWKSTLSNTKLLMIMALVLFMLMMCIALEGQLVILLKTITSNYQQLLGFVASTSGLGALISSVILSQKKQIKNHFLFISFSFVLLGSGYFFLASYSSGGNVLLLLSPAFIIGFGLGITIVVYSYAIKTLVEPKLIGRVSGVANSMQSLIFIIGTFLGGVLITWLGAIETFHGMAFVIFFTGLFVLSSLSINRYLSVKVKNSETS